jgi:hypothetical protein
LNRIQLLSAAFALVLLVAASGCTGSGSGDSARAHQTAGTPVTTATPVPVTVSDLYRALPAASGSGLEAWKSVYVGRFVSGSGTLESVQIVPNEGLYLIISVPETGATGDMDMTVFSVTDAAGIRMAQEEGTFLINGVTPIHMGSSYGFSGKVAGFPPSDSALSEAGYGNLILIEGRASDIRRV